MVVYDEFHLYSNKKEAIIKDTIWIILWISGVYSILKSFENNILENASVIATAYFMFSLSLMMEFFTTLISNKTRIFSKLFHGIFSLSLILTFVCSSIIMFTPVNEAKILDALFYFSIVINICFGIDIVLSLFFKSVPVSNMENDNLATQKFKEKSRNGALGNIKEQ